MPMPLLGAVPRVCGSDVSLPSVSAIQELPSPRKRVLFAPVKDATYVWLLTKTRYEGSATNASRVPLKSTSRLCVASDATAWYGESGSCASLIKTASIVLPLAMPCRSTLHSRRTLPSAFGQIAELTRTRFVDRGVGAPNQPAV
jgi:hypothetical protein